jgi:hypothetical protein
MTVAGQGTMNRIGLCEKPDAPVRRDDPRGESRYAPPDTLPPSNAILDLFLAVTRIPIYHIGNFGNSHVR